MENSLQNSDHVKVLLMIMKSLTVSFSGLKDARYFNSKMSYHAFRGPRNPAQYNPETSTSAPMYSYLNSSLLFSTWWLYYKHIFKTPWSFSLSFLLKCVAVLIFMKGVSRICSQEAIISSNTIQLDVSMIASKAGYPEVSVVMIVSINPS